MFKAFSMLFSDVQGVVIGFRSILEVFETPRPAHYDKNGMERYRVAFLAENKLWLQACLGQ